MRKITKILSLGILFLFVCTLHLSAQKCKYNYNRTDPITNESAKGNTFSIHIAWKMGFNKLGDTYHLGMYIRLNGNIREFIRKGDPLIFKLSNGEVVTLNSSDEFLPAAQATENGIVTVYQGKYDIDVPTLQKIAANSPTYVRMNIESRVYEKEISAKDGKKITHAATCILQ
jgi:hypothetical protein